MTSRFTTTFVTNRILIAHNSECVYTGLGTVTVAADGRSGTFALNDGKATGTFDYGADPASPS